MPFSLLKFGLNKDYPFEQSPDLPQPSALKPAYDVVRAFLHRVGEIV